MPKTTLRAVLVVAGLALITDSNGRANAALITYEIQSHPEADPWDQSGYTVTGTITVDSAFLGIISSTGHMYAGSPYDDAGLTSPIVGWSFSVYDYTGDLVNFSTSVDPGSFAYQDGGASILATRDRLLALDGGGPIDLMLSDAGASLFWTAGGSNAEFILNLPHTTLWSYHEPITILPDGSTGELIGAVATAPEPSTLVSVGTAGAMVVGYTIRLMRSKKGRRDSQRGRNK